MELTDIPDFIPRTPRVELQMRRAIRSRDAHSLLSLMEETPEAINYLIDLFPPLTPADLIRTGLKSRRLMEILLYYSPPLRLDQTCGLTPAEMSSYRRLVRDILGYVPSSMSPGGCVSQRH